MYMVILQLPKDISQAFRPNSLVTKLNRLAKWQFEHGCYYIHAGVNGPAARPIWGTGYDALCDSDVDG